VIAARRQRAEELRERYAFAGEVLTLYLALLDVHERIDDPPPPEDIASWAATHVVPAVIEATERAGPAALAEAVRDRAGEDILAAWLAGEELDLVDRYLARASLAPVLEALRDEATPRAANGHCPRCGGSPQLGVLAASGEALVSGGRSLQCSRCNGTWNASRSACPACGESDEAKLVVFTEQFGDGEPVFPHLRVSGCRSCNRYLIDVDLDKDGRAVPEVDELAALPLDLYAADQGLTKVTPNLMGF
jgi:formate dehydrogenase accessory protein FdhE